MFVLNILILGWFWILDDFHMFCRFANLARTLVILYWTSIVEPPSAVSYCRDRNKKSLSFFNSVVVDCVIVFALLTFNLSAIFD